MRLYINDVIDDVIDIMSCGCADPLILSVGMLVILSPLVILSLPAYKYSFPVFRLE